jgi:hypothetical protein
MSPGAQCEPASMQRIAKYFEASPTFLDDAQLGKMRDSYPLDLFTLYRAYVVMQKGNSDGFFDRLIFALWTVAIENRKVNMSIRSAIIETLFPLFFNREALVQFKITFLRGRSSPIITTVTMGSRKTIQRFICRLTARYVALLTHDPSFGLD